MHFTFKPRCEGVVPHLTLINAAPVVQIHLNTEQYLNSFEEILIIWKQRYVKTTLFTRPHETIDTTNHVIEELKFYIILN